MIFYQNLIWNYEYFQALDGGCYSHVGRQGGVQELNLKKADPGSGCFRLATIMHEFLHGKINWIKHISMPDFLNWIICLSALGFYHMQSAYDRDEYVTIVWDNISSGKENNFNKYNNSAITHFNTTYDYYSVMHYGPYGFSKNGNATIVPVVSRKPNE